MRKLILIGASGHGKVLADIARNMGYETIEFLDDNPQASSCGAYPVIGKVADAQAYRDCDFAVAIGNAAVRKRIQNNLAQQNLSIATLIHPKAVIGENVSIGEGTAVMAGAVINPSSVIGKGCIINTCASVDHDNNLGDFVHVSVGAHLAGTVTVGEQTWIGAGATVSNNVEICAGCMIGAGAVVVKNITQRGTYIGVPAKLKNQ